MKDSVCWEAHSYAAGQEVTHLFKEPEYSLLCLQEPDTWFYPEPYDSSPHGHIIFVLKLVSVLWFHV